MPPAAIGSNGTIDDQLNRRVPEVRFSGQELVDVVDFLRDLSGSRIYIDWRAIEAAGIPKSTPVNAHFKDTPFREALDRIVNGAGTQPARLAWIADEGGIEITTQYPQYLIKREIIIQPKDLGPLLSQETIL
jgi:hypothetical protein